MDWVLACFDLTGSEAVLVFTADSRLSSLSGELGPTTVYWMLLPCFQLLEQILHLRRQSAGRSQTSVGWSGTTCLLLTFLFQVYVASGFGEWSATILSLLSGKIADLKSCLELLPMKIYLRLGMRQCFKVLLTWGYVWLCLPSSSLTLSRKL